MVKVKICGITNWTDARISVEEGADFLGFNFYRMSPRYITPAAASKIIKRLPKNVVAVGVFVNETEQNVLATARRAGLCQIQLHGDEPREMVSRLGREYQVTKALRVRGELESAQLARYANADALLLDGFDGKVYGGTGKTFDWQMIRRAGIKKRIFLAGGITPENVEEAVRIARPYAVDVCSGIEARPGKKDPKRIAALMNAVKSGTRSAGKSRVRPTAKAKTRKSA